ncbi:MAG: Cof-type family hydrolase [Bacillales bacterium]|jgi:Cof subfamily protein (haloacid dehalogenase superfamily)|nr:Cof-type family hydrolase [Bacillales bacterium]
MNNKHMIALDLDGTLLNDDKVISSKTKAILGRLKEAGHEIVIATGRPNRGSINYYNELALRTPKINFNGALVHKPYSSDFNEIHMPLDINKALDLIRDIENIGINNIITEIKDHVYISNKDFLHDQLVKMGNPKIQVGPIRQNLGDHPTSILVSYRENEYGLIRNYLEENHSSWIEHRHWGAPFNIIEIIKTGINKAYGLKIVADHLGVEHNNIIAFGDEDNDLEMIKFAGIGVAMGNAIPELKSCADIITKTNNEDGIANALEEIFENI